MPNQAEMSDLPAVRAQLLARTPEVDGGQPQPRSAATSAQTIPTSTSAARLYRVPAPPMVPGNETQVGRGAVHPDAASTQPTRIPAAVIAPLPTRVAGYGTGQATGEIFPNHEGGQ